MPVFPYEDPVLHKAVAPLSSSSMTLFPLGSRRKFQQRSVSAEAKPARPPSRRQEGVGVSVCQGVLTSLAAGPGGPGGGGGGGGGGARLGVRPALALMHPSYQKWRLREPQAAKEGVQGDAKASLKDAIQKINRLTLNAPAAAPGARFEHAPRNPAARERKGALKAHIEDLSNMFHNKSKSQLGVNKSNARKQQDIKYEIRKYFEENGVAMSVLASMKGITPIKLYRPRLPTIFEETDEELARYMK